MNKLLVIFGLFIVLLLCSEVAYAQTAPNFVITGPDGSSEVSYEQVGDVVYLELRSIQKQYAWGNQLIEFNPNKLECVSIEEGPDAWHGQWNWWIPETGDALRGEPGNFSLYYYDQNGLGSDWAQQWVLGYGPNNAGPSGSYDNATGQIRLYYSGYVGYYDPTDQIQSYPIRIGFKVKSASPISFTVYSNMLTSYNWYKAHMDSIHTSVVDFITEEDLTPPVISILSPEEKVYTLLEQFTVNFSAEDFESGIQSCQAYLNNNAISNGTTIMSKNLPVGRNVFYVDATNNYGLSSRNTAVFDIIVTADDLIVTLEYYASSVDSKAIYNSILKKFQNYGMSISVNNYEKAKGYLTSALNEINAQTGKHILLVPGDILAQMVDNVIDEVDLEKAKEDAKAGIDKSAESAKKKTDESLHGTIDAKAEEAKSWIDKYGSTPAHVDMIVHWTCTFSNFTNPLPQGWTCVAWINPLMGQNPVEVPSFMWMNAGVITLGASAGSPVGTEVYLIAKYTGTGAIPFGVLPLNDTSNVDNAFVTSTLINTQPGVVCDLILVEFEVWERLYSIGVDEFKKDELKGMVKFLIHLDK